MFVWGRCAVIWRHFIANDVLMQLSYKEDSADPPSVLLVWRELVVLKERAHCS